MKILNVIATILVIIGGINWGLIGIFEFNLVAYLLEHIYLDRIVYVLVGISSVYLIFALPMMCRPKKG